MRLLRLLFCFIVGSCFAVNHATIKALITNNTNQTIMISSDTSIAQISPNVLPIAAIQQPFDINFTTITPRGLFLFNDQKNRIIKKLLIVLNGVFQVSSVVCVPISSCKAGNPRLDNNIIYFALNP